jgi:phytoene/squalene synthetase
MPAGSLFEVSSRFLQKDSANQLLALYALRKSITPIPLSATDDTVKWAKLKWWSEELVADPAAPARHPVVRALHHSGARKNIDNQALTRLIGDAIMQIDVYPDADRQSLFERLTALGETDIALELALDGAKIDDDLICTMGMATGLYAFVSMLLAEHTHWVQLLPLDMLAEYRVTSADLKSVPPRKELADIMTLLAKQGVSAFESGFVALSGLKLGQVPLHLSLRWHLEARRLNRIVKNASRHFAQRSNYGPSDVWFAWRYCRKA